MKQDASTPYLPDSYMPFLARQCFTQGGKLLHGKLFCPNVPLQPCRFKRGGHIALWKCHPGADCIQRRFAPLPKGRLDHTEKLFFHP